MSIRTATQPFADQPSTLPWIWLLIATGWGLALAATFSGQDWVFNHHVLIEGGRLPLLLAGIVFLLAWQLMTITMMLPASVTMLGLFLRANRSDRGGWSATAAFLTGYLLTWSAFGLVAFSGDILVHQLVHRWSWLGAHPRVIAAATLFTAAAFQFTPPKSRWLARCRAPRAVFAHEYRPGRAAAWALGLAHGRDCLGYCWALMLVMFGLGMGNVIWMAGLAGGMYVEKAPRFGKALVPVLGTALLVFGALVIASPTLLAPMLGDPA